jgi:hypothetical protein
MNAAEQIDDSPRTAYQAAQRGIGAGVTITIERYKWAPERIRSYGGAEWYWNYRAILPGVCRLTGFSRLDEMRGQAAIFADTLIQSWDGKTFKRGPQGGLKQVRP